MSTSLKEVNDKISKAQAEQMRSYFIALEDFKNGKLKALNYDVLNLQDGANSKTAAMSLSHLQSYKLSLPLEGNLNLYIRLSGYKTGPTSDLYPNREVFNIDIYNFDFTGKLMECEDLILLVRNNSLEIGCNAEKKSLLASHFKLGTAIEKMQTQGSKSVVKELNEGIIVQNNPTNVAEAVAAKSATLTPMAAMQSKQQRPLNQLVGGAAPAAAAVQDDTAIAMSVRAKAN